MCGAAFAESVTAPAAPLANSPFAPLLEHDAKLASSTHRVARLEIGYDALLLRVHLIRAARRSIELQTFIWSNDECGRLMMWELIAAARRGVRVRLIVDQLFSEKDPELMAFLATAHPNLEVKHYRPAFRRIDPALWRQALAGLLAFRDTNQRMHNKVFIVDGAVLVTGGRNIENAYFDHATTYNYRDRDVIATGPSVAEARRIFEEFWAFRHAVPTGALKDVVAVVKRGSFKRYDRREDWDFGGHFAELSREADDAALVQQRFVAELRSVHAAEFVSDEPGKSRGGFAAKPRGTLALRAAVAQVQDDLLVQTPYLVLSPAARELVRELRERRPGLRIRISSNSFASTDNLLAYSGNYRLRGLYLGRLGLEVHEMKPRPAALPVLFPRHAEFDRRAVEKLAAGKQERPMFFSLHAKSFVVDRAVSFVGSYNVDPRSENLNTEAGLLVQDEEFARGLRAEIERDLRAENSWVIARRDLPLPMEAANSLIGGLVALTPVDVWPLQNTASFELKPGAEEVAPGHRDFFRNYRDVGAFPGAEGWISQREIVTRLYKAVGKPLTPIL